MNKRLLWKLVALVAVIGLLSVANVLAAEETISGIIEESADGIVLKADDGQTFAIQGQDLSEMVGKSVKATGTLEESESGKIINVIKVEEVEMKK